MSGIQFTATEATILIAVILSPILLLLIVAIIKGYSIFITKHHMQDSDPPVAEKPPAEDKD